MNYAGGCAGVSLFMWHLLTQSMKEFPGYSLSVWVGGGMAGGGGRATCHIFRRKKRRVHVREHSRRKKKKKGRKKKDKDPFSRQGSVA